MRVFTFFVEPSSYTIDLIKHIHNPMGINYIFLSHKSYAKPDIDVDISPLSKKKLLDQLRFLRDIYRSNNLIIFNGYNQWQFQLLFLINLFSFQKKILAIESDTRFKERKGMKKWLKKLYLTPIFSNRYTLGFSGGNHTHKDLFIHYGMKEERIFLMPMMVDNEKFYRKRYEQNKENFTFLFVGRMIPLKQIEMLISAFLNNFENGANVSLSIVGSGELYEPLKTKYGHHKNIFFKGAKYAKELIEEYHRAHVLVLPSNSEQWGLVVNEAMAAGLPVIASDEVGAIYDLIIGKDTGMVFDHSSVDDLALKMKEIYEDREKRKLFSKNAQRLMKEHWNYDLYRNNLKKAIEKAKEILGKKEEV